MRVFFPQAKRRGTTFIEMIVVIGIFSMIAAGVTAYFVRIWPLQRFAMDSAQAQLKAAQSITKLVEMIRNMRQSDAGDYALVKTDADEIIFFVDENSDGLVERVRIFRDGTTVRMGVIRPSGNPATYPAGQETLATITSDVRNGSQSYPSAVFHYFDDGNEELTGNFSLASVRMVSMDVYVDINPSSSPEAAHFESFASIRNLSEYDRA